MMMNVITLKIMMKKSKVMRIEQKLLEYKIIEIFRTRDNKSSMELREKEGKNTQ